MQGLSQIIIKAKRDIYTYLSGNNQSKFLGHGYDFAELDEYVIGDDIRNISWINSASKGKFYTKRMHQEREQNIVCCALIDGRMIIDNKYQTLISTLASISYLSNNQKDILTLMFLYKNNLISYPASKNESSIYQYISDIDNLKLLDSKLNYNNFLDNLLIKIAKKSLIFMVGDFLDEIDLSILSQKYEIIVIIIRSHPEENPLVSSNTQLINPQTLKSSTKVLSKQTIKYYKAKLQEHDKKLFEHFQNYNIRYAKIYNDSEIIEVFNKLF